ncbi:hypothetical protein GTR02_13895 [Kineococcus sp. R8]|uniref:hypothetical protein n=1 Tax=Kineococcus siccus TaxID=2696567 RepID=UPI001411DA96|nr:hypothetical protein [Kineococcus siccus]NAZ82910.1 hypothetical protein [Kineococcus siccus]
MPGPSSPTVSVASVLAAQAYVESRPAPAPRRATTVAEPSAPAPVPTDGSVTPVGDARRARHWSTLGAARRAVL